MTVKELADKTGWKVLAGNPGKEISSAYVCDLLSWVMARGREGTAWITVQTHLNVIAVASLHEFSCVIIPDGIDVSAETVQAANDKDICLIGAKCTSYGAARALSDLGIGEV